MHWCLETRFLISHSSHFYFASVLADTHKVRTLHVLFQGFSQGLGRLNSFSSFHIVKPQSHTKPWSDLQQDEGLSWDEDVESWSPGGAPAPGPHLPPPPHSGWFESNSTEEWLCLVQLLIRKIGANHWQIGVNTTKIKGKEMILIAGGFYTAVLYWCVILKTRTNAKCNYFASEEWILWKTVNNIGSYVNISGGVHNSC